MKSLIFAYVMIIILLLAVILNSIMVSKSIKGIVEMINDVYDTSLNEERYQEIYDEYLKRQRFISLSIDHSYLGNVETGFTEVIAAAKIGEYSDLVIAKSRLLNALAHVRRLASINIDSIC